MAGLRSEKGKATLVSVRKRGRPKKAEKRKRQPSNASPRPDKTKKNRKKIVDTESSKLTKHSRKKRSNVKLELKEAPSQESAKNMGSSEAPASKGRGKRTTKVKPIPKRRRITRKTKVKDLSVSLGLEKPPHRLSRAKLEQLDDDELQDQRFKEELHKLTNLDEVIRLSTVRDHDSDDDSIDGEGGICMGFTDDEDDQNNAGDGICPRPLPKRGRGNQKFVKKKLNDDVSKEEVKEMCLIIKSSMRKSLTSRSNNVVVEEADYEYTDEDCDDNKLQSIDNRQDQTSTETNPNFIICPTFRQALDSQEQWLNEMTPANVPLKDHASKMCVLSVRKNRLEKQLYVEHLSWMCKAVIADDINVEKEGALAWVPSFRRRCLIRYAALIDDPTPGCGSELDGLLCIAVVKALGTITNLTRTLLSARGAILDLMENVKKVNYAKLAIIDEFENVHEFLNFRGVKFDESSTWGLKPIRLALEPPYFKTEDGLMAYPMTPDVLIRMKNFGYCFFKRDKQKWTTKDLQQLKSCIKETLYSKRLSAMSDRYEVLMADCLRQYEEDMLREGRFDAPPLEPFKRRRGRPKKEELEYSTKYGIIYPVVAKLPNGITIRSEVTPRLLTEWRTNEEKILKTKSYEDLVFLEHEKIDWATVANKMVVKSRKHRTAEDCELAWRHEVHPKVNDKRWGVEESKRLKEIYIKFQCEWSEVARELNVSTGLVQKPSRTPYQCFFRVRNRLDPPKKIVWNDNLDQQVLDKLREYPGNWRLVAASIDDPASTKRQAIERYKKTINPVLRNGAFTRVEDCLLILTIEKLKPFLAREGHFGCLLAYLPWRCETTWRDRANNLFSDWIVPWTLEEDKMLLQLAKTMNRNWQKISEEFTSFKNRKGCLTRYKILMRRLKDERFNNSLEAYHEAYAMTRYNVFQYKHLKEILELLAKVRANPLPEEDRHFPGLLRDREPSEVRLQHMLLTFDRDILNSAIQSLTRYVHTRDNYWRNWISKHGERKRTFDRRTFHPENPQSVASALHIRGLELKPKEDITNLSDFENEIYKFYARFRRTKALKEKAERPYIPDKKTLAQWSAVSRLIETAVDEEEDVPLKRKWKALKSDAQVCRSGGKKKGTAATSLKKTTPRIVKATRKYTRQAKKSNLRSSKKSRVTVATNEEGYILIPPEILPKRSK